MSSIPRLLPKNKNLIKCEVLKCKYKNVIMQHVSLIILEKRVKRKKIGEK
jgi:hypothetical protein